MLQLLYYHPSPPPPPPPHLSPSLLMKWRFENRISKQMEAIKKGFNDVFPLRMLQIFDEREMEVLVIVTQQSATSASSLALQVLLCGVSEINVEDWKRNTVYAAGYTSADNVIVWFWKVRCCLHLGPGQPTTCVSLFLNSIYHTPVPSKSAFLYLFLLFRLWRPLTVR